MRASLTALHFLKIFSIFSAKCALQRHAQGHAEVRVVIQSLPGIWRVSDTFNTTLRLRQALALAIVVVVLGGTMLRSAGIGIHRIYWFQEWLGGDIAVHILMGAFLTAAGLLVAGVTIKRTLVVYGVVLLVLVVEETSQLLIPERRRFLLSDLAWGVGGASLVAGLVLAFHALRGIRDRVSAD